MRSEVFSTFVSMHEWVIGVSGHLHRTYEVRLLEIKNAIMHAGFTGPDYLNGPGVTDVLGLDHLYNKAPRLHHV